jgi:coatomer protein complex subunit alpha (xenin)
MGTAFKNKCFIAAASFSRRLLELPEVASEKNADLRSKASKVLAKSEQMARNEHELDYDENKGFVIDAEALAPLYRGQDMVKCSYCGSSYAPANKGKVCTTCNLSTVGVATIGLVTGA